MNRLSMHGLASWPALAALFAAMAICLPSAVPADELTPAIDAAIKARDAAEATIKSVSAKAETLKALGNTGDAAGDPQSILDQQKELINKESANYAKMLADANAQRSRLVIVKTALELHMKGKQDSAELTEKAGKLVEELGSKIKGLGALGEALGNSPDAYCKYLTALENQMSAMMKMQKDENAVDVLKALNASFPGFSTAVLEFGKGKIDDCKLHKQYKEVLSATGKLLKGTDFEAALNSSDGKAQKLFDELCWQVPTIADTKLPAWLCSISAEARQRVANIEEFTKKHAADPLRVGAGQDLCKAAIEYDSLLNTCLPKLRPYISNLEDKPGTNRVVKTALKVLDSDSLFLKTSIAAGQQVVKGNYGDYKEAQIPLYYFRDVIRLIKMLNPETDEMDLGSAEAGKLARQARKDLESRDVDVAQQMAALSGAQKDVQDLQDNVSELESALQKMTRNFNAAQTGLSLLRARKYHAELAKQAADQAVTNKPDDPKLKDKADEAALDLKDAENHLTEAQASSDQIKTQRDEIQGKLDSAVGEQKGLREQLKEAEKQLSVAATTAGLARLQAQQNSLEENRLFADSRDDQPLICSKPDPNSTDCCKRVMLYAFKDKQVLFVRGNKDDIRKVRGVISEFDLPEPQARLTLWTLQVSNDVTAYGSKEAADLIGQLRTNIGDVQAKVDAANSLFVQCLSEEINRVSKSWSPSQETRLSGLDDEDKSFARSLAYYSTEVIACLSYPDMRFTGDSGTVIDSARLGVLKRCILDPRRCATLGEALVVFSLGNIRSQMNVLNDFYRQLPEQLTTAAPGGERSTSIKVCDQQGRLPFMSMLSALGFRVEQVTASDTSNLRRCVCPTCETVLQSKIIDPVTQKLTTQPGYDKCANVVELSAFIDWRSGEKNGASYKISAQCGGLTPLQKNLTDALHASAKSRVNQIAVSLAALLRSNAENTDTLLISAESRTNQTATLPVDTLRLNTEKMAKPSSKPSSVFIAELKTLNGDLADKLVAVLEYLADQYHLNGMQLSLRDNTKHDLQGALASGDLETAVAMDEFLDGFSDSMSLRQASPEVATANGMLRDLIMAVETDLDAGFFAPLRLRVVKDVIDKRKRGISMSNFQQTSVMATNRFVARVDPKGSSQMPMGETIDILQETSQLGQLYAAAQGGPLLAALEALNSKNSSRKEERPQIYGITTGNVFQVTPVADPTGQSLRFNFDYVLANMVREPNDTTNPSISRTDRHSVNTEIELKNFDLKMISEFSSNDRLGLPDKTTGGLPVLKHINMLKQIPLIGWFTKTRAVNARALNSLVFAHTAFYPTIGDVANLLTGTQ